MNLSKRLKEKWNEAVMAVLPILAIVMVLCFTIAPMSPSILLSFIMGAAFLLVGMMFFTLGAEMAMTPMGERVGACLTKSKKLAVILPLMFLLGFIITISEPDLQVLAEQVPAVPNMTLILAVAAGVGFFLLIAALRMFFSIPLPRLLKILSSIGLEAAEKALQFCFVTGETWTKVKQALEKQMKIDVPGSGIAFIVPMASIGGKKTLKFLVAGHHF